MAGTRAFASAGSGPAKGAGGGALEQAVASTPQAKSRSARKASRNDAVPRWPMALERTEMRADIKPPVTDERWRARAASAARRALHKRQSGDGRSVDAVGAATGRAGI